MSELTFESYVEELTEELGPHYKYGHDGTYWVGFIYCECAYGKNFECWPPGWQIPKSPEAPKPPMRIPGAVARIEPAKVIVLDHRLPDGKCDAYTIEVAQPNFREAFLNMRLMHDEYLAYLKSKRKRGRRTKQ